MEQQHRQAEIQTSALRATGRNTNFQCSASEAREDDSGIYQGISLYGTHQSVQLFYNISGIWILSNSNSVEDPEW